MDDELPSPPEHRSSLPFFSGVPVPLSLVFYVVFCRPLFILLSFFFHHCIICFSFVYRLSYPVCLYCCCLCSCRFLFTQMSLRNCFRGGLHIMQKHISHTTYLTVIWEICICIGNITSHCLVIRTSSENGHQSSYYITKVFLVQ